jgi:protein arginine N-methyltransferase 1
MYDKSSLQALNYHYRCQGFGRVSSLQRAIEVTVKPGWSDLGVVLEFWDILCAARAPGKKMGGVEIIDVARRICKANGFADRMVFIDSISTEAELPEPVDVIITETIGNFGVDEGILASLIDAKKRFLKPGGTIIPRSLELFVAPVEHSKFYSQIEDWGTAPFELDFSAADMAVQQFTRSAGAENLLPGKAAPRYFF